MEEERFAGASTARRSRKKTVQKAAECAVQGETAEASQRRRVPVGQDRPPRHCRLAYPWAGGLPAVSFRDCHLFQSHSWPAGQSVPRVLTDLVVAAALPPHTCGFTPQLLDPAHTWSERGDNDIDLNDILALAAAYLNYDGSREQRHRHVSL